MKIAMAVLFKVSKGRDGMGRRMRCDKMEHPMTTMLYSNKFVFLYMRCDGASVIRQGTVFVLFVYCIRIDIFLPVRTYVAVRESRGRRGYGDRVWATNP